MNRSDQWKLGAVIVLTGLAIWQLFPSFTYFTSSPAKLQSMPPAALANLRRQAIHLGLDLQGGLQLLLEVDKSRLSAAESRDATDRAMEIIRNRVDQFGVAEPLIQREGEDRIAVQLPGLTDRARAIELIGKTALLEFKLVRTPQETQQIFDRLDAVLAARSDAVAGLDSALRARPLTSHMMDAGLVRTEDEPVVRRLLATPGIDSLIPSDVQLAWGNAPGMSSVDGKVLYVLKREPEMTGGSVASADAQVGLEQTDPGAWGVSMKMTPRGRSDFARVTGDNVGRQLAIVLDGFVSSAPSIRDRIPSGDASITGSFDVSSSRDLAIVLRAGALPAPVTILEERTVGPSLGSDSIRDGIKAGLIGTALVIVFMVVYYQLSGIIAIAALALNILLLAAGMAMIGSTLTLPGIAGVVLTVGMAVDANVLIFERIREELRGGRSVREAVRLGYDRAFRTIFDANVTTLLSSLFLFWFGTGPIRGFAVTLSLGLLANMFTAVFFTRMIYDFWLGRTRVDRLSI